MHQYRSARISPIRFVWAVLLNLCLITASVASEKDIQWAFKSQKYPKDEHHVMWNFKTAHLVPDNLRLTVIAHNSSKDIYQCFFVTGTEKTIHMDDDFGNEYHGMQVSVVGNIDNKLAPNQRKKIHLVLPRYQDDVALVNLHFGLYSNKVASDGKCQKTTGEYGYNFHQLDLDVSRFKAE